MSLSTDSAAPLTYISLPPLPPSKKKTNLINFYSDLDASKQLPIVKQRRECTFYLSKLLREYFAISQFSGLFTKSNSQKIKIDIM